MREKMKLDSQNVRGKKIDYEIKYFGTCRRVYAPYIGALGLLKPAGSVTFCAIGTMSSAL
jgi:hypothetical protein